MSQHNQYQAPQSQVDRTSVQQYSEPKIFGVNGRIGRVRYIAYSFGVSVLVMLVAMIIAGIISTVLGESGAAIGTVIIGIAYLFLVVYSFMVAIQRSHDFNTSGWLSLLILVPLVSLIFFFIPGTQGENNYGAPPPPNSTGNIIVALIVPVIAIVGILAAIAIPAYQGYVEQARQNQQYEQQR